MRDWGTNSFEYASSILLCMDGYVVVLWYALSISYYVSTYEPISLGYVASILNGY